MNLRSLFYVLPQLTFAEQLTAAEYNVGVKVLVLNNHFQGMVKQWQDLFYDERYSGTPMFNPCYANLAEACGIKGLTCVYIAACLA